MRTLYEFPISGNCHKVRLLLSLLKLPYTSQVLNGAQRQHKTPEFLALNPFGQVPVLVDGEVTLRDSQAILVYLARRYGEDFWFPQDAQKAAAITAWLSVAANEVTRGPNALRLHHKFARPINIAEATAVSEQLMQLLNSHLAEHEWLANNHLSIADIAVYPYIALAHEGQFEIAPYKNVFAWLQRIEQLDGYVTMPGINAGQE